MLLCWVQKRRHARRVNLTGSETVSTPTCLAPNTDFISVFTNAHFVCIFHVTSASYLHSCVQGVPLHDRDLRCATLRPRPQAVQSGAHISRPDTKHPACGESQTVSVNT